MRDLLAGLPEIGAELPDSEQATLVLHSMREAFFYARKCCRGKLPDDEIYSACYEALCEAARNWQPGGNTRFFGYAKLYIRGRSGLAKLWKSKDVVRNKGGKYHDEVPFPPEVGEVESEGASGLTGMLLVSRLRRNLQEDAPICEPDIESVQLREEYALLQPMLKQLTDKEQSVISLRYRSGLTFERIGGLLGTSPADSQATHARALRKLRRLAKPKLGTIK